MGAHRDPSRDETAFWICTASLFDDLSACASFVYGRSLLRAISRVDCTIRPRYHNLYATFSLQQILNNYCVAIWIEVLGNCRWPCGLFLALSTRDWASIYIYIYIRRGKPVVHTFQHVCLCRIHRPQTGMDETYIWN